MNGSYEKYLYLAAAGNVVILDGSVSAYTINSGIAVFIYVFILTNCYSIGGGKSYLLVS